MRERLPIALRRLWPDHRWSPVETGRDRIYSAEIDGYEITVEWNSGMTTLVLSRCYGETGESVSTIGTSQGMTAEAIRRAYLDAVLAWRVLQSPPRAPTRESAMEVESDRDFFRRLGGL